MPITQSGLSNISKHLFFRFTPLAIIGIFLASQSIRTTGYLSSLLLPSLAHAEDQDGQEDEDNDDEESPSRVQIIDGIASIHLTIDEQSQSGLISKQLTTTHHLPEQRSYGKVINIQGLVKLRSDYQAMLSKQAITKSTFETARQNYQRLKQLHKEAIIPAHKLQLAQSAWQSAQIKVNANKMQLQNIHTTAEQSWGSTLTQWALDQHSPNFQQLLKQQQMLIMISLKANQSLLEDTSFIFIARDNDRQKAHKAYLISAAPYTGTSLQGETYFFRCSHERLRIGMQIHAWMPQTGQSLTGVTIPESAIVWHAGKPWVYLQTDSEHFTRQALPNHRSQNNGGFVSSTVFRDHPVVTTGGQMLLSEEFRWQIPEEDDD